MKFTQTVKKRSVEIGGGGLHTIDPREDLLIRNVKPTLELAEIPVIQGREMRIGEAAENQIHLAHTAMPASK
jgi:hypothetical protein